MNFFIYDLTFLVVFTAFVAWFLYTHRENLKREGIIYLYPTKFGIKAIEWTAKKFKGTLRWLQYVSIATGYLLMGVVFYFAFQIVWIYVSQPQIVRAVKIPPILPLVPYLPSIFKLDFLPPFYFTYWILILAVVAITHEFAHGIFARFHNIKVKSTGFGFLGPFLAAFVEPDENQMAKRPIYQQLSVLSAGTFANVLTSIFFILVFVLFFSLAFAPAGALFNTYSYSAVNLSEVNMVNGIFITNPSPAIILTNLDFENEMNLTKIRVREEDYYLDNDQFQVAFEEIGELAIVYDDAPAVLAGLNSDGAITGIDEWEVVDHESLAETLTKYSPGDEVIIKTKTYGEIQEYDLVLGDNGEGKALIGIGLLTASTEGIRGKIFLALRTIRDPGTLYEPTIEGDLISFIYELLWWMILINISVALMNMLPVGIFDGGRVFYLTILKFTKSKTKAKKVFKFMTMFLLFLLGIIMLFWFFAVF